MENVFKQTSLEVENEQIQNYGLTQWWNEPVHDAFRLDKMIVACMNKRPKPTPFRASKQVLLEKWESTQNKHS